ncbi:MAG TPA: rod shape-determining protein MreD [Desulfocapsa sulfexigens]|nr:rod shape-determining protein MreD [Desulfocapsa sulfexigens]
MVTLCFLFLGFILIAIQTTVFHYFPHWLGRPDLAFILLVFSAYKFSWLPGLLLAFLLGWLMDVSSGVFPGTYPLLGLLIFSIVKFLSQNSPVKETAFQIPLVGVSYFIVQCIFYLFFSLTQPDTLPPWSWARVVQETLILLVASIPCFIFFSWVHEKIMMRRKASKSLRRSGGNRFR